MSARSSGEHTSDAVGDRLRFGALMIAAIVGAVAVDWLVLPGLPTAIVVGGLAILCAAETAAMLRSGGMGDFSKAAVAVAVGAVVLRVASIGGGLLPESREAVFVGARFRTAEIGLGAFLVFAVLCVLRARTHKAAETLGAGALVVAVPTCILYLLDIRYVSGRADLEGLRLLIFLVAVSKIGDIAAYFVGTRLGSHKLIPTVSPGKTWEGAIASLVAATGSGALLGLLALTRPLDLELSVLAAVAINLSSQLGDLVESLLKRGCGVKDSGRWIPQFGGAFDLVDSLFLAAPVFYGFLRLAR